MRGRVLLLVSQYGSHQVRPQGWRFPHMSASSVYVPSMSCSTHPPTPGDSPRPAGRCGPGSYQLTAFALVPVRVRFCGRPLRVKPLFTLSCGAPAIKPEWLWGLVFPVLEPRAGEPDMRLKARTPVGERLQCIYSPACGSAVCRGRGYGI